jgi:HEAT repeat protein
VRRQLAVTLGEMGDESVLPVLELLTADGGVDVMSAAEGAIRAIRERAALEHPEEGEGVEEAN